MKNESLLTIQGALQKAYARCQEFNKIVVSISGGADSDVMLDLMLRAVPKEKLTFVFFDTGIEYQATKRHLDYLEEKYDITIDRQKAETPVPLGCKKFGLPFLSKHISNLISQLQSKKFDFKNDGNKSVDYLTKKYPNIRQAIRWWCNDYPDRDDGKYSTFNIGKEKYLKDFLIENPPDFSISDKCCQGAKKNTAKNYCEIIDADLNCTGLRKSEGGIRSSAFKNCFEFNPKVKLQQMRPIWWLKDTDKAVYDYTYKVKHSDCYSIYGLKRTGCCGCPFGSRFEQEIKIVEQYEPKLYKAITNIFGKSYEYTRKYREYKYRKMHEISENQISIDDLKGE